ncbi:hypothetical protein ACLBR5_23695 [Escherichia coli]
MILVTGECLLKRRHSIQPITKIKIATIYQIYLSISLPFGNGGVGLAMTCKTVATAPHTACAWNDTLDKSNSWGMYLDCNPTVRTIKPKDEAVTISI